MALKIVVPGSGGAFAASGLGRFTVLPQLRNDIFAGYMLGTSYTADPTDDLSGNGRDLSLSSGSFGSTYLDTSSSVYCTLPFSGDDLVDAHGEGTICAVVRADPAVNHIYVGNWGGSSGASIALAGRTNATLRAINFDGSVTGLADITPVDSDRGTQWYFYAGVFTSTSQYAYVVRTGVAAREMLAAKADGLFGGSDHFRVGYPVSPGTGSTGSTPDVAYVLAYNRAATKAELDQIFAASKALLAKYSFAI
jgi:hypothetical protein